MGAALIFVFLLAWYAGPVEAARDKHKKAAQTDAGTELEHGPLWRSRLVATLFVWGMMLLASRGAALWPLLAALPSAWPVFSAVHRLWFAGLHADGRGRLYVGCGNTYDRTAMRLTGTTPLQPSAAHFRAWRHNPVYKRGVRRAAWLQYGVEGAVLVVAMVVAWMVAG